MMEYFEVSPQKAPSTVPSHARMAMLPDDGVRWTSGFWAEKFAMTRDSTLPGMLEALRDPENGAYLGNFRAVAEGRQEHRATFWSDGDCYKFLQALAHVYDVTGDRELMRLMDEIIAEIAGAQEPDGYINTQITATGKARWADQRKHEHYNLGHLFTAAVHHYRITGQRNFLDIAIKAADCVHATFSSRPRELAHYEFNPSNIMGLVELFTVTGDRKHLELANIFVELRGTAEGGIGDANQDRVPLRTETKAYGHAVTATYLYAGAADVYSHTGDGELLAALEAIWADVTQRKLYITGGAGALHVGVSERAADHVEAEMVWEAFGGTFQLPNASAYNETCANIGLAMWAHRMLQITGEARYADIMELVLYNAGLSGVSLSGTEFTYTNPLRWHGREHNKYLSLSQDSHQRWNRWKCYCCPPQVARTLAGLHRWTVSQTDSDIWLHLFGGSRVTAEVGGGRLAYEMKTEYPWDGHIVVAIEQAPDTVIGLNIRIPSWASGAQLLLNGKPFAGPADPGSYAELRRRWQAGDSIELILPLEAKLVSGHPRVEEIRNHLAVMRGPVVYCLEGHDLPKGVSVKDVFISPRARFDLSDAHIDGARILAGKAAWIPCSPPETLYGAAVAEAPRAIDISLIPYYAWNNRGVTEMSVWLPAAVETSEARSEA